MYQAAVGWVQLQALVQALVQALDSGRTSSEGGIERALPLAMMMSSRYLPSPGRSIVPVRGWHITVVNRHMAALIGR
jgi:hypothetical protein